MQKVILILHTAAAVVLAALAAFNSENSLLTYSALAGMINLICSLTVCLAVRAASSDGGYNMRKLHSIEKAVSIEALLFTLPLFLMATPFSSDIIFIFIINLTFIVLFISIIIADNKYK